ncbi:hypothetical protein K439DRAFT_1622701 [Ramaria rubella]|nr:hypothetical protein K439DRAFT_1622701 [Ramaria rubella]
MSKSDNPVRVRPSVSKSNNPIMQVGLDRENQLPIDEERTYPFSDPWRSLQRTETSEGSQHDPITGVTPEPSSSSFYGMHFPRHMHPRQSPSPSPSPTASPSRVNRELEESVHSALSGLTLNDAARWDDEGRGRRSRLSLRNTLNAAEHYASSLLLFVQL